MEDEIRQIAERIKELREISGVSVETLASELGISGGLLSDYEKGSIETPLSILHKIASKNGIPLSALLSGEEPRLRVYSVVRKDKGLKADRRKQYKYESLAYNFINKKAEPYMVRIEPDEAESPAEFNSHTGQEFNYIVEGTMKMLIDDHEIILNEGDSIYYDSGHKHAMKAMNNAPVKMLTIIL